MQAITLSVRSVALIIVLTALSFSASADFGSKRPDGDGRRGDGRGRDNQGGGDRDRNPLSRPLGVRPSTLGLPLTLNEILKTHEQGQLSATLGHHVDQNELEAMAPAEAFLHAFEEGDELFEIRYNLLDGVGANVGNGQRFTQIPRLDLQHPGAWAQHFPQRVTGPNAESCASCHRLPVVDGGGDINSNNVRIDPQRLQKGFIERQTPPVFGLAALQLLAEEITAELKQQRATAQTQACQQNKTIAVNLLSKGVGFGALQVSCQNITYQLKGIDEDLVVKPYEWKGSTAFLRDFIRGAAHQELGMQAEELVGNRDGDFDGVSGELSVGDMTALTLYTAAQPRPVSLLELNQLANAGKLSADNITEYGLPLTVQQINSINKGQQLFEQVQCSSCHTSQMQLNSAVFKEPSQYRDFRDEVFPDSSVPIPRLAIEFDLTADMPDNQLALASGEMLGNFEKNAQGKTIVRLYGDLRRHNMGNRNAEEIDAGNVGASVFMTENLWGVGSTAPYMHDGRATTLTDAIFFHEGEALNSRQLFLQLNSTDQQSVLDFLKSLVLFKAE
jgi:hypothetical protein